MTWDVKCWDVLRMGRFELWDALRMRRFESGMFGDGTF